MNIGIYEIISLVLGLVGAAPVIWYIWKRVFPTRRLSWKSAEKSAKEIVAEMTADNFLPSLIVGIGRGGAIMGALISGALGHRPLIVIDREFKWNEEDRTEGIIFPISIPPDFLEKVLLVSGEVHTGRTMKMYYDYLGSIGAKSILRATYYYEKGAPVRVDYKGLESSDKKVRMPWMFTGQYLREDRGERKRSRQAT